ncbi:hypothetical protein D1AOALGA4SA_2274 [Olavius algarvensis Delta 1 endosymbiont]|nr:hypothetical protein D1AOALGA4SA_2274 [Olavius algarvensis Delta 1 endosymbiont]
MAPRQKAVAKKNQKAFQKPAVIQNSLKMDLPQNQGKTGTQ